MSSNLNIAAAPTQDEEVIIANREFIKSLRHRIEIKAGDNSSLLGTTADGVQLLLFAFSNLIVSSIKPKH
ncbi:hypothetical protein [Shewanella marina]|uniref:hypothetical protein n=1 Tax=Shewanella marina TaxID=487319 RepID=UPI00046F02A1|nr:hypothetical protein [Shewanella marina]